MVEFALVWTADHSVILTDASARASWSWGARLASGLWLGRATRLAEPWRSTADRAYDRSLLKSAAQKAVRRARRGAATRIVAQWLAQESARGCL